MRSYSSDTRLNQNSKFTLLTSRLSSLILEELHTYTSFKVNWACDRDMIMVSYRKCGMMHSWQIWKWFMVCFKMVISIRGTPERHMDMLWFSYTKDFRDHVKWYKPHTSKSNLTSAIKRMPKEVTFRKHYTHIYHPFAGC